MVIKFTPNTIKKHQSKLAKMIETDGDSEWYHSNSNPVLSLIVCTCDNVFSIFFI